MQFPRNAGLLGAGTSCALVTCPLITKGDADKIKAPRQWPKTAIRHEQVHRGHRLGLMVMSEGTRFDAHESIKSDDKLGMMKTRKAIRPEADGRA